MGNERQKSSRTSSRTEARQWEARIEAHLRSDQLGAARILLTGVPATLRSDPRLQALDRVLAPAVTRPSTKQGRDRAAEFQWLREFSGAHAGRWVAVQGNELLADAATMPELVEQLKTRDSDADPLIHRC